MARDTIAVTSTVRDGVAPTLSTPVAANDGEMANDSGKTVLIFVNGMGAASGGATAITPIQVDCSHGRTVAETPFAIAQDIVGIMGPFPPMLYNQADGTVQFDYDLCDANARCFGMHITGA